MKKKVITWTLIGFSLISILLTGFQHHALRPIFQSSQQDKDDTLLWQVADRFTTSFNNGDVATMRNLLPDDFMLQWMHVNFLEKKGLLISMLDTSIHSTLEHRLDHDSKAVIRYADDHKSASLNASFQFLDPAMVEAVKKENCYGLCIMYFQKRKGRWHLQTVHLDLHCTLCNI